MRFALSLAFVALATQIASAQAPAAGAEATLTLDEAISLARRHNPLFLQTTNARRSANVALHSAYGDLLPSVTGSFGTRFQQGGEQFFSGVQLSSTDQMQSSYSLNVNYSINSQTLLNPKLQHAYRNAAEADVRGAAEVLRGAVTQQYLNVLQAQARAELQDTLMLTTQGQLELAKARQAVGAATILDVRRAEVALGQAEVAALQAHNLARVEMLRLFQQLGVAQPTSVTLATRFNIAPVNFKLDSVLALSKGQNPTLLALRSRENAASLGVKAVAGLYAPTLSLSTGWGGNSFQFSDPNFPVQQAAGNLLSAQRSCFTQDSIRTAVGMPNLACDQLVLTDAMAAQIRAENDRFPFKFTKAPRAVTAFLSIPIFNNYNRERQLQEAQITRDNAKYTVRARELQLTADVTQAFLNLETAVKTVELQEQNAIKAREELAFAEERYRVGAATFLDVTTSRGTFEQAQIDRLNAIYDYHKAFAALESAVGRPLR